MKGFLKFSAFVAITLQLILAPIAVQKAYADNGEPTESQLKDQLVTDLIAAGVSVAVAASGSVPLALLSGYITKYISTYGVEGVKALITFFKGREPQDLGEINIYYLYLVHIKRNLYQSLIEIRKSVENVPENQSIRKAIEDIDKTLKDECNLKDGCKTTEIDDKLVNLSFINIALDAKASLDVNRYLQVNEIKNTYQYLMLLYLDLVIVEQKLLEAQTNALATKTFATMKLLKNNRYISNDEKEYQGQMLVNMVLRWELLADQRRVLVAKAIEKPIQSLESENDKLRKKLDDYKKRTK